MIVTAGGTGGHIFPAIAIAEELRSRGVDILYVGNRDSLEEKIVQEQGLPFSSIDVQKLYRSVTLKHLLFPYKFFKSCLLSRQILNKYRPDACIGTGGFVSAPILICAGWKGIPLFLQEQNGYPGLTTRLLSKKAQRIFIAYEAAMKYLPGSRCQLTGNPLQKKFSLVESRSSKREITPGKIPTLLILGGSQGAQKINNAILEIIPELLKMEMNILWQTGKRDFDRIESAQKSLDPAERVEIFPFSNKMIEIYQKSDLAISRAGALTLAELEVMKIPSIVIPLPHSAGNHQYYNAKEQELKKMITLIEQTDLSATLLLEAIKQMKDNLKQYEMSFTGSKHLKATDSIVNTIIESLEAENCAKNSEQSEER